MTVGKVMMVPNKFRLCAVLMFQTVITVITVITLSPTLVDINFMNIEVVDHIVLILRQPFIKIHRNSIFWFPGQMVS